MKLSTESQENKRELCCNRENKVVIINNTYDNRRLEIL